MKHLSYLIGIGFFTFPCCAHDVIEAKNLSLIWGLPFVCVLLSLAFCSLLLPKIWHRHYGKITGFFGLAFIVMFLESFGKEATLHLLADAILLEYMPFVALIFSLYTVSTGIQISGPFNGTPLSNLTILGTGTLLASLVGTTGASMLLINLLIRSTQWRLHRKHTIIFFIFLVSNIGGSLTPLGDPPLFLGFLQGVPFFWTTIHLFPAFFFTSLTLLTGYYLLDSYYFLQQPVASKPERREKLKIQGKRNILLLLAIMFLVLLSGEWKNSITFSLFGVTKSVVDLMRDLGLFCIGLASIRLSRAQDREANHFSWEPVVEIAKIFFAIFITVWPVITILHAAQDGDLAFLFTLANKDGQPNNFVYFWLTGLLSSVLDNAPTYLVFFHMAGGDVALLTTTLKETLMSISLAAVFMGAMTYIGNAPNFMVRSIAEKQGIQMPSFFGYMGWSFGLLAPLMLVLSLLL